MLYYVKEKQIKERDFSLFPKQHTETLKDKWRIIN